MKPDMTFLKFSEFDGKNHNFLSYKNTMAVIEPLQFAIKMQNRTLSEKYKNISNVKFYLK